MAGFWTGVLVGAAGLWIIQFGARKLLGGVVNKYGGEVGTYIKGPTGKQTNVAFHASPRRGMRNAYFDPSRVLLE